MIRFRPLLLLATQTQHHGRRGARVREPRAKTQDQLFLSPKKQQSPCDWTPGCWATHHTNRISEPIRKVGNDKTASQPTTDGMDGFPAVRDPATFFLAFLFLKKKIATRKHKENWSGSTAPNLYCVPVFWILWRVPDFLTKSVAALLV